MGSNRFWLKAADEENKSIPHEFPRSHWLKATGQCVLERYLSAIMQYKGTLSSRIKTADEPNVHLLKEFDRLLPHVRDFF